MYTTVQLAEDSFEHRCNECDLLFRSRRGRPRHVCRGLAAAARKPCDCDDDAPRLPVYGILYTHHKVPDGVLAAVFSSVRATGLPASHLIVVATKEDDRIPRDCIRVIRDTAHWKREFPSTGWVASIYEQILAGLDQVPDGAAACLVEHDVLYPYDYFCNMREEVQKDPASLVYYTNLKHFDLNGRHCAFWDSDRNGTYMFLMGLGGTKEAMAHAFYEKYGYWFFDEAKIGCLEPVTAKYRNLVSTAERPLNPLVDIKHDFNTSNMGFNAEPSRLYDALPGWGTAARLRRRLRGET